MSTTRKQQEAVRAWLLETAAGNDTGAAACAVHALNWIAEMGSPLRGLCNSNADMQEATLTGRSDAEKEALEWLDSAIKDVEAGRVIRGNFPSPCRLRTLKALLAEPRLPAKTTAEDLVAIKSRLDAEGWALGEAPILAVIATLYAHLTAPKTKKIWRVCWKDGDRKTADIESIDGAMTNVRALLGCGVSVTIEHVEVPND